MFSMATHSGFENGDMPTIVLISQLLLNLADTCVFLLYVTHEWGYSKRSIISPLPLAIDY